MSDTRQISRSRRFWLVLAGVAAFNGAAAMTAYAMLYGYFRWPEMIDPSLPFGGLEFLAILLLIGIFNLFLIGRLYDFNAFDAPWSKRKYGMALPEMVCGVVSMLLGGLGTVLAIQALSSGVTIFDRSAGYFAALLMTVLFIVMGVVPAIVHGERTRAEREAGQADAGEAET